MYRRRLWKLKMKKRTVLIVSLLGVINFAVYRYAYHTKDEISYFDVENPVDPQFNQVDQFQFVFKQYYDKKIISGKPFNKKWNRNLLEFGLFNMSRYDDSSVLRSSPVVVTAFSSSHFENGITFLDYLAKIYKTKILHIYDIGLRENETNYVKDLYKDIVAEIKPFHFEKFPDYVSNLQGYRWKPLILATALKEFPSIWWIDSSVRLKKSLDKIENSFINCSNDVENCRKFPWILVGSTDRSVFTGTNPNLFEYLPIPESISINLTMYAAKLQLIYATYRVKRDVLRFLVLCALEKECMAPTKSNLFCLFLFDRSNYDDVCHHYDQSVANILLAWAVKFNQQKIVTFDDEAYHIVRNMSTPVMANILPFLRA